WMDAAVGVGGTGDRAVQRTGIGRRQDTGDMLDSDPVRAHGLQPAGRFDGTGLVDHRARAVNQRTDDADPRFTCRLNRDLEVSEVVERVEHLNHTNAVFDRLLDEGSYHSGGMVRRSEQRLAADQPWQGPLYDRGTQRPQARP